MTRRIRTPPFERFVTHCLLDSTNAHACPTADRTRTVRDRAHLTYGDARSRMDIVFPESARRKNPKTSGALRNQPSFDDGWRTRRRCAMRVWSDRPHAARTARPPGLPGMLTSSTIRTTQCCVAATRHALPLCPWLPDAPQGTFAYL